jgi:hypothetical protein
MLITGRYGVSKTFSIEEALRECDFITISSHVTPFKLYTILYENRDKTVFIDDLDYLIYSPEMVSLLKQALDTKENKEIMWESSSSYLKKNGIPHSFTTRSKFIITVQDLKNVERVLPLKDRSVHLDFRPDYDQIIQKIDSIKHLFGDSEPVYQLLKKFGRFGNLTIRSFVKAMEIYKHTNDWKRRILQELEINPKLVELNALIEQHPQTNDVELLKHWKYSRKTFYEYKKKLSVKV